MDGTPAGGGFRWTGPQQEEGLGGQDPSSRRVQMDRTPAGGGFRWTGPQQEEGLDGQDPSSRRG